MTGATALFEAARSGLINHDQRQEFLSLYRNRIQGILRPPGCKTWVTVSKHFRISDDTVYGAVAGSETNLWGLRSGDQTRFAVFDIDLNSRYHSAEVLQILTHTLAEVGLTTTVYQSSESGGWHVYLFFDDWHNSQDIQNLLKSWLRARKYEIRNGTLEVFPSGMGLRLPLQSGFAWLDQTGDLIQSREDLSTDEAINRFLNDLRTKASNWEKCKTLIESQLSALDCSAGGDAQAHEKSIDTAGFDGLFSYRLIPEKYQDGRDYWQNGLSQMGQRHDAVLAVEHYLWHGDSSLGVPALPGEWNDESRYRVLLAWLKEKHNGYCRHINRGNWRKVEAQITRSVKWRRPTNGLRVVQSYPMTERSIERLITLSRSTGRTWTPDDLKKGNDGREQKTRAKISAALERLLRSGSRVGRNELARESGCSPNSVSRHVDLWLLFASGSGDQNPFLDPIDPQDEAATPERVALPQELASSALKPVASRFEKEISSPVLLGDSWKTSLANRLPGPGNFFETRALAVIRRQNALGFSSTARFGDVLPTKLTRSGRAFQNVNTRLLLENSALVHSVRMVGRAAKNENIRQLRRAQRRLFILPYFVRAARSRPSGSPQRQQRGPPCASGNLSLIDG